ncbi:unnamed protein product [Acanthoscelides obtectus]|uniref:Uncharacterized protein n=1 Tax=Acanthoscelides obtectus TaxID=200917 RepID=A0A9P0NUH4_ACAOB|nr:unnamed protein product [Acanthoscelides obtectus]CAK1678861.1 hypothetical protein AOBTE_LOCUS32048 [Acanthoscelides obtectus]
MTHGLKSDCWDTAFVIRCFEHRYKIKNAHVVW